MFICLLVLCFHLASGGFTQAQKHNLRSSSQEKTWETFPCSEAHPSKYARQVCQISLCTHSLSLGVRNLNINILAKKNNKEAMTILRLFPLAKNIHRRIVLIRNTSSLCLRKKIHWTDKQVGGIFRLCSSLF